MISAMRAPLLSPLLFVSIMAGCSPAAARPAAVADPPSKAAPKAAKGKSPKQRLSDGEKAWTESRYADAEADFRAAAVGKQRGEALVMLGKVLLITGRYTDAVETAKQAARTGKGAKAEAAWIEGAALRREGKLAEAEAALRAVENLPEARRARLLLGELLIEQGRRSEAETPLMTLIQDYNDDVIEKDDADGLAMVGRAAHLLRSPHDANDAFNEAERAQKGNQQLLLWRAELFLEKYDPGHAEEVLKEVLDKAPNHPEALVWMAQVRLDQMLDFDEAERLARKALKVNPKLTKPYFVLAGIALRDMELSLADLRVKDGLKHNPRDLELLSMKAAVRFLSDDDPGFDKAKRAVLKHNSEYSKLYQIVGEYAEWEHRYEEIVKMMREAVRIDSEDAKAHAQLGLNLIRAGQDDKGVASLRTAFDKDPFNVRVYNTLNLYEKTIPKEYVSKTHGQFEVRYPKGDVAVLERYVPQLLNTAWRKMTKSYGFTPSRPVGVELYGSREHFAVRTSGLPSTAIQGVCFGKTLASMSPTAEPFNLGQTLWHELAHVFHIQLSKYHVPRWFTEGLAEYETIIERDEWAREYDVDLYRALRDKRLPKVGAMNKAFTRAEELSDVAMAYYASSQILVMLGDRYGNGSLNKMLSAWGAGERTPAVVQGALGKSPDAVDAEFRDWASKRLARYEGQFVPLQRVGSFEEVEAAAKKAPKDADKQTEYALVLLRKGDAKQALKALDAALEADPKHKDALWLKARVAMGMRNAGEAQTMIKRLLAAGGDGYVVQMALADLAEAKRDEAGMQRAFRAAHAHDPSQAEPIQALVDMARKAKDDKTRLWGLRKLAKLEQHDSRVYRRLMALLLEKKEYKEALDVGEAAVHADTTGLETHQLFAEVLAKNKMVPRAIYELESALLCKGRPKAKADVHAQLAETYLMVPNRGAALKHAREAKKIDGSNERLGKLKKKLRF